MKDEIAVHFIDPFSGESIPKYPQDTPWSMNVKNGYITILDANGEFVVAETANFEYICRACSSYPGLVKALDGMKRLVSTMSLSGELPLRLHGLIQDSLFVAETALENARRIQHHEKSPGDENSKAHEC